MHMRGLQTLIGLIIQKIERVHDYLQLVFSDGTTLNIYNNHRYDSGSIFSVEGEQVASVIEADSEITFKFQNGGILSVGMRDEDYNGPEAMQLIKKGEPPIVWS